MLARGSAPVRCVTGKEGKKERKGKEERKERKKRKGKIVIDDDQSYTSKRAEDRRNETVALRGVR